MSRALIAARLSHYTDASTSVERQVDVGKQTAKIQGHDVVGVTEDVDVSGSVSPWERADLGPWLTDPDKLATWDVLIVAKLDRLSRSIAHLDHFIKWCEANGKSLVSVAESLDLSSATGKMMAKMIGLFAEWELARMSERQLDARKKLRGMGAWSGGSAPFGYDAVSDGHQYYLHVNESEAELVREMAQMILDGRSSRQVTKSLNERGIPSVKGKRWDTSSVLSVLRNPIIYGVMTHEGNPVLDPDGMPVRIAESVIDDGTWTKLQDRLDANAGKGGRPKGATSAASLLTGVARCSCGEALYIGRRMKDGKPADRIRHRDMTGCGISYTYAHVTRAVEADLMSLAGHVVRTEKVLIKGKGHAEQIARIEASINDLDTSFENGEVPAAAYGRMQARLEAKLSEAQALHEAVSEDEREDRFEDVPTGVTYADYWTNLDDQSRGQLLRDLGVSVVVGKDEISVLSKVIPAPGPMTATEVPRFTVIKSGTCFVGITWGDLGRIIDRVKAA